MREVLPDILMWSRLSEPHGYDFNGHLVRFPAGNVVTDPVEPDEETADRLVAEGVAAIVVTNRNHTRAANRVRELTGARTIIHPSDEPHARAQGCEIDDHVNAGMTLGPFEVIAAPGKSPGEIALIWTQRRLLLVGDVIIGNPPGDVSLLPEEKMDDPRQLHASVKRLAELDVSALLVGDGAPILENADQHLTRLAGRL